MTGEFPAQMASNTEKVSIMHFVEPNGLYEDANLFTFLPVGPIDSETHCLMLWQIVDKLLNEPMASQLTNAYLRLQV